MSAQPSAADMAAIRRLLGMPEPSAESVITEATTRKDHTHSFPISAEGLQSWTVPSSTGIGSYAVTELLDTRNGGIYLRCTCPSWAPLNAAYGAANCKHTTAIRQQIGG